MVQNRNRVRSVPGIIPQQLDVVISTRSKSLSSLNWFFSSPSTDADSSAASSFSLGGDPEKVEEDDVDDEAEAENHRHHNHQHRRRSASLSSSSSRSMGNLLQQSQPAIVESIISPAPPITDDHDHDHNDDDQIGAVRTTTTTTEDEEEVSPPFENRRSNSCEEDDVFNNSSGQIASTNSAELSVIDEEKDDAAESSALLVKNESEANKSHHNDDAEEQEEDRKEIIEEAEQEEFGKSVVVIRRNRSSVPFVPSNHHNHHARLHSSSSLDIPASFAIPPTENTTPLSAMATKSSLRRGLSSSFLTTIRPADRDQHNSVLLDNNNPRRPLSHAFELLDKGTILASLTSPTPQSASPLSSTAASRNLDRNLSVSTPSIDSAVSSAEIPRGHRKESDSSSSRKGSSRHIRTPSMVVPAITPRIPLAGLLPSKISKPVDRSGDGTKSRERSSGFFGSRSKRAKQNDSRPHFWIKNSCSNSDCCHVCNKPLANTDAYQCNDCLSSVHASCKGSLDKAACNKIKHPKPGKMQTSGGPLRAAAQMTAANNEGQNIGGDHHHHQQAVGWSLSETLRSASLKNQRHSVAGVNPDAFCISSSLTAPAGLTSLQAMFVAYPNGFRSYMDMEESWAPLDLWQELPEAWSAGPGKLEKKKLSSKEIKRQDNFHEMFITEQHHCQTLTVLKCTYYAGLLKTGILPLERLNQLLPCLDELLDIHYRFFRSLKEKRDMALVVSSVHDALVEQFSGQMQAVQMRNAYTQFCFQKDATVREYHRLMASSGEFANFIKTASNGVFYKSRSLPDCLLLITQRLSKYHSFVENLRKNTADDSPEKEGMKVAEKAVKDLIAGVDSGIEMSQMQRARVEICNSMDPKSCSELSVQEVSEGRTTEWKELFKVDDLRSPERTLLYYGDVFWQNARQKPAEITLLLFTDLIVFLQKNSSSGGGYNFFRQDQKNGVIKLHKLIVRDKAGRLGSQGIYLIAVSPKPDMYDISCKSKKELSVWMDRIQRAVQAFSSRNTAERQQSKSLLSGNEEVELQTYFGRLNETNGYMRRIWEERMQIYADLFDHIGTLPLKKNEDRDRIASIIRRSNSNNSKSVVDQEDPAAIWKAMQKRFGAGDSGEASNEELRSGLLTEESESEAGGNEEIDAGFAPPSELLGRSKTFHFVAETGKKPKLRKHPTVAGIPEIEERSGKRLVLPQLMNEIRETDSSKANEATLYLLNCWADFEMQIEELNQEKLRLTTELALAKEHRRQTAGALVCDNGLENLRRLSSELEARKKKFDQEMSDKAIELNCREKALKEREDKVLKEDKEIRSRWTFLTSAWENQRAHGLPLPALVAGSPSSGGSCSSAYADCGASSPAVSLSPPRNHHHHNQQQQQISPQQQTVFNLDSPSSSSSSVSLIQRTCSFRPGSGSDAATSSSSASAVPAHLAGAATHAGRAGAESLVIRQQLPTALSSKDVLLDSLSKKLRASSKDKTGGAGSRGKKYFLSSSSSKSPDRQQVIPNKLAIKK